MYVVEIDKDVFKTKANITVGVMYRPPNTNVDKFNESLCELCDVINPSNKNVYIVGDFNIDLLKHNDHSSTNEFIDTIYGYSLIPSITRPTRVTSHTSTLIDNILCSLAEHKHNVFKGILSTNISYHYPVFFIDPTYTDHAPPAHCTR